MLRGGGGGSDAATSVFKAFWTEAQLSVLKWREAVLDTQQYLKPLILFLINILLDFGSLLWRAPKKCHLQSPIGYDLSCSNLILSLNRSSSYKNVC